MRWPLSGTSFLTFAADFPTETLLGFLTALLYFWTIHFFSDKKALGLVWAAWLSRMLGLHIFMLLLTSEIWTPELLCHRRLWLQLPNLVHSQGEFLNYSSTLFHAVTFKAFGIILLFSLTALFGLFLLPGSKIWKLVRKLFPEHKGEVLNPLTITFTFGFIILLLLSSFISLVFYSKPALIFFSLFLWFTIPYTYIWFRTGSHPSWDHIITFPQFIFWLQATGLYWCLLGSAHSLTLDNWATLLSASHLFKQHTLLCILIILNLGTILCYGLGINPMWKELWRAFQTGWAQHKGFSVWAKLQVALHTKNLILFSIFMKSRLSMNFFLVLAAFCAYCVTTNLGAYDTLIFVLPFIILYSWLVFSFGRLRNRERLFYRMVFFLGFDVFERCLKVENKGAKNIPFPKQSPNKGRAGPFNSNSGGKRYYRQLGRYPIPVGSRLPSWRWTQNTPSPRFGISRINPFLHPVSGLNWFPHGSVLTSWLPRPTRNQLRRIRDGRDLIRTAPSQVGGPLTDPVRFNELVNRLAELQQRLGQHQALQSRLSTQLNNLALIPVRRNLIFTELSQRLRSVQSFTTTEATIQVYLREALDAIQSNRVLPSEHYWQELTNRFSNAELNTREIGELEISIESEMSNLSTDRPLRSYVYGTDTPNWRSIVIHLGLQDNEMPPNRNFLEHWRYLQENFFVEYGLFRISLRTIITIASLLGIAQVTFDIAGAYWPQLLFTQDSWGPTTIVGRVVTTWLSYAGYPPLTSDTSAPSSLQSSTNTVVSPQLVVETRAITDRMPFNYDYGSYPVREFSSSSAWDYSQTAPQISSSSSLPSENRQAASTIDLIVDADLSGEERIADALRRPAEPDARLQAIRECASSCDPGAASLVDSRRESWTSSLPPQDGTLKIPGDSGVGSNTGVGPSPAPTYIPPYSSSSTSQQPGFPSYPVGQPDYPPAQVATVVEAEVDRGLARTSASEESGHVQLLLPKDSGPSDK